MKKNKTEELIKTGIDLIDKVLSKGISVDELNKFNMKEENKNTDGLRTKFQITQNYGNGCRGYLYFKTVGVRPQRDLLERIAIKKMNEDWNNINPALYFTSPKPARPTVEVAEYADGKKVKNGIKFKCKWR